MENYKKINDDWYMCKICNENVFVQSNLKCLESFFVEHINGYFHEKRLDAFKKKSNSLPPLEWQKFLSSGKCNVCLHLGVPSAAIDNTEQDVEEILKSHEQTTRHMNMVNQDNEKLEILVEYLRLNCEVQNLFLHMYKLGVACLICHVRFDKEGTEMDSHLRTAEHLQNFEIFLRRECPSDISNIVDNDVDNIKHTITQILVDVKCRFSAQLVFDNIPKQVTTTNNHCAKQQPALDIRNLPDCLKPLPKNQFDCTLCKTKVHTNAINSHLESNRHLKKLKSATSVNHIESLSVTVSNVESSTNTEKELKVNSNKMIVEEHDCDVLEENFIMTFQSNFEAPLCMLCNKRVGWTAISAHVSSSEHKDNLKLFESSAFYNKNGNIGIENILDWGFDKFRIKTIESDFYYCQACLYQIKSYTNLMNHLKTKTHNVKISSYKLFQVEKLMKDPLYHSCVTVNNHQFVCSLCNLRLSADSVDTHLRGKKHQLSYFEDRKSYLACKFNIPLMGCPYFNPIHYPEILFCPPSSVICIVCASTLTLSPNQQHCNVNNKLIEAHLRQCSQSNSDVELSPKTVNNVSVVKIENNLNTVANTSKNNSTTAAVGPQKSEPPVPLVNGGQVQILKNESNSLKRKSSSSVSATSSSSSSIGNSNTASPSPATLLASALCRQSEKKTDTEQTNQLPRQTDLECARNYMNRTLAVIMRAMKSYQKYYCYYCDLAGNITAIQYHLRSESHNSKVTESIISGVKIKIINCTTCKLSVWGPMNIVMKHNETVEHKTKKELAIAARTATCMGDMIPVDGLVIKDAPRSIMGLVSTKLATFGQVKCIQSVKKDIIADFVEPGISQAVATLNKLEINKKKYVVHLIREKGRAKYHIHSTYMPLLRDHRKLNSRALKLTENADYFKISNVEREKEKQVFEFLVGILSPLYPKCKPHAFGSRLSGLTLENIDFDIFFDCGDVYYGSAEQSPKNQEDIVRRVFSILKRSTECRQVLMVPRARVPIVTFEHKSTEIKCDVSFKNGLSVQNTKLVQFYLAYDSRVKPFILLLKEWFTINRLHGTPLFSSYAISMMAIFYLQQLDEPILPSVEHLQNMYEGLPVYIRSWKCSFYSAHNKMTKSANNSTVVELVKGFFRFYSTYNFEQYIISPLTGKSLERSALKKLDSSVPQPFQQYLRDLTPDSFSDKYPLCVMDPFDLSHNLTKSFTLFGLDLFTYLSDSCYLVMDDRVSTILSL